MTEQEIIKVLKENLDKGVCLGFMPDEMDKTTIDLASKGGD